MTQANVVLMLKASGGNEELSLAGELQVWW